MASIPSNEEMYTELCKRHGKERQDKFRSSCVAVCGLGGLGSNIALSLARAGVGTLILIDFDRVDVSNLHRQQYFADQIGMYKTEALENTLKAVMPYINIKTHTVKINKDNIQELLSDADVICEAFDVAEEKAMLVNEISENLPQKYIVCGSGMAGFDTSNSIKTRRLTKRIYICGDETSDVSDAGSLVSTRVMLCAAHQAHTVLRILSVEFDI